MNPKREVDLRKLLNNPAIAREFIAGVDWHPEPTPECLILGETDVIIFKTMSDKDAVRAAKWILNNKEVPRIERSFQLELFPH